MNKPVKLTKALAAFLSVPLLSIVVALVLIVTTGSIAT